MVEEGEESMSEAQIASKEDQAIVERELDPVYLAMTQSLLFVKTNQWQDVKLTIFKQCIQHVAKLRAVPCETVAANFAITSDKLIDSEQPRQRSRSLSDAGKYENL